MKVVVQRVLSASCVVDDKVTGKINQGYMLLVGFTTTDTTQNVIKMAKKIASLRVFEDEQGKMNKNIYDVNGEILSISQFTLYADASSGNRPSFINSMKASDAIVLYEEFNRILQDEYHIVVKCGIFGADMRLDPICSGPVTIILEN